MKYILAITLTNNSNCNLCFVIKFLYNSVQSSDTFYTDVDVFKTFIRYCDADICVSTWTDIC